jgi:hypothetical protein
MVRRQLSAEFRDIPVLFVWLLASFHSSFQPKVASSGYVMDRQTYLAHGMQ